MSVKPANAPKSGVVLPKQQGGSAVASEGTAEVKGKAGWAAGNSPRARQTAAPSAPQLDYAGLRASIVRDPQALKTADPAMFQNRHFMKILLAESGGLLEVCPPYVKADRELVEVAVRANPNAIAYASDALRADRELGMLAVKSDGYSITMLAPELQRDRGLALEALKTSPWCLRFLPNELRGDRELVRTAALGSFDALADTTNPALFNDVELMRELATAHPLTLNVLEKLTVPNALEQLIRENPELRQKQQALNARLERAEITTPGRLGSLSTLEQVLDNREHPERTDGRPLAVMAFALSDHNNAMHHERFADVAKHYRLMYYELYNDKRMAAAIGEATRVQPAELMMIAGHGQTSQLTLVNGIGEKSVLDLDDREKFAGLENAMRPGGHVVLKSCDTGGGKGERPNIANLVANIFPTANVYAPTISINNWLQLGDDGKFLGPGYLAGAAYTHHVKPSDPGPAGAMP